MIPISVCTMSPGWMTVESFESMPPFRSTRTIGEYQVSTCISAIRR